MKIHMTKRLFVEAILKFLIGIITVATLIFGSAGTVSFWNGWLLICILFVPMLAAGIVMMIKNPELLKKRLNVKEKEKEQVTVIKLCGIMFVLGFIVAGLDYRFYITVLPRSVSIVAATVFLVAYLLYSEVLRENIYLSRTVEVQVGQIVIDTGLYGIVRHPMYSVTLLLFWSMPFILGSLLSFMVFLVYPLIIAQRIKKEEELLENELKGYKEYQNKVKYKLIPFIW